MKRIVHLTTDDLCWDFKDSMPTVSTRPIIGNWPTQVKVDPHPGTCHDLKLVKKIVKQVESCFPLKPLPIYHILDFEVVERVNGWCSTEYTHKKSRNGVHTRRHEHQIILSGKRIPIHPAMTRYLIPHEYGHAVEGLFRLEMFGDRDKITEFRNEYAKIRGIKDIPNHYGAATWSLSPGEIFANDFRILVCGLEEEFWPHVVPHPQKSKAAKKFWKKYI